VKEQVKAVGIEDSSVSGSEGGVQRNSVHDYDVGTHQMKCSHEVAPFHSQIRQAKHEPAPMPIQKLLHRHFHQFKDFCQSSATVKFFIKVLCSLEVQVPQRSEVSVS